jgi:hypothetical protein
MQMTNSNPTPNEIRQALLDYGVDVKFYRGWDSVGRPWKGPDGSPGLTGGVIHHTANPGAKTGGSIEGVLGWAVTAYELPVCNMLIGKDPNQGSWLLSAGSVYHCGDGGPVPALGIPERGYLGQTRLFGIEIDDPGIKIGTLTDYQIDNTVKTMAALAELAGWDIDKSILTHKCYTDGCHGANPHGPSPCIGRKNDTLEGAWATWPGDQTPAPYNALWWREEIKALSTPKTWDGTIPTRTAATKSASEKLNNKAAWRCACRLYDIGIKQDPPQAVGKQSYPLAAMRKFQEQSGIKSEKCDGMPNKTTWIKLFGKDKP